MLYQHISFDKHFLRKFLPGVPLSLMARGKRTWAEKIKFLVQKQTFHNNFHLQKCLKGLFSFLWIVKTNSETSKFTAKWNLVLWAALITYEHTKCWFSSSYLEDLGIPEGIKSGNHKKCRSSFIFGFFFLKQYSFTKQHVNNIGFDSCHIGISTEHAWHNIPCLSHPGLVKWMAKPLLNDVGYKLRPKWLQEY